MADEPTQATAYDRQGSNAGGGERNLPVPDPTRLTTQLVDRALSAFERVVDTRLSAMDQATKLVNENVARLAVQAESQRGLLREDVDRQFGALREIVMAAITRVSDVNHEQFVGIQNQFGERDTRLEQTDKERRISLDAALAAAKEAVAEQQKANALAIGKSEDGTKERLDALALLMTTSNMAMTDKIDDLKDRVSRAETTASTRIEAKSDNKNTIGMVVGVVGLLLGIVIAIVGFAK